MNPEEYDAWLDEQARLAELDEIAVPMSIEEGNRIAMALTLLAALQVSMGNPGAANANTYLAGKIREAVRAR